MLLLFTCILDWNCSENFVVFAIFFSRAWAVYSKKNYLKFLVWNSPKEISVLLFMPVWLIGFVAGDPNTVS